MPKIAFSSGELADYFNGAKKSPVTDQSRSLEVALRVHAEGTFPEKLISTARPHESPEVLAYRKTIYKAKTKPVFTKIYNSLSKIRRSVDWSISYPGEAFPKIPEGEMLSDYMTDNYPYFTSITNWCFQVLLREYLIDPNAIIVVKPVETEVEESELLKPYAVIINSKLVVDFKENDYAIYENELGATYRENETNHKGKSFYVITTRQILRYDQSDSKLNFKLAFEYKHELNELPAYKIGAVVTKTIDGNFLYESRISGVLPSLDEVVREYSDLQAAVIMHIYPERWEFGSVNCSECGGTGKIAAKGVAGATEQWSTCGRCKGTAMEPITPFSKILIKPAELGQQQVGVPPAGYVEKDVDIVKLQDERIKQHIFEALASVNLEFLAEVPLANSGIAKEVDKDETNNFVHSVAEDLVRCIDWVMYISALMRYKNQYSEEEIETMLPDINVPEHFDIFSTKFIEEELKTAKDNKLNPVLINEMEIGYANKKFSADPDVQKMVMLVLTLDPLANVPEDDKLSRLTNKGIRQSDYVLSSNINEFIKRAVAENENFLNLDSDKQKGVIQKFVDEVLAENDEPEKMKSAFLDNGGNLE